MKGTIWVSMLVGTAYAADWGDLRDPRAELAPMERALAEQFGPPVPKSARPAARPSVGTRRTFWAYDYAQERFYEVDATCRAAGDYCYVFVADDQWGSRVSQTDVDGLLRGFEDETPADHSKGVFQRTVEALGEPLDVDGDPKVYVLLLDIRDGFEEDGRYIGGYFSGVNEYPDWQARLNGYRSNEIEIFYVDVNPGDPSSKQTQAVLAHELQHMIHFGYDRDEEDWINEGCSVFSEWWNGFGPRAPDHFKDRPDDSLVEWDGDLADYEQAGMFVHYLYEHWGGIETVRALVQEPADGVEGVDQTLKKRGYPAGFRDVFRDWVLANYVDDPTVGDGRYAYEAYDLHGRYRFSDLRMYDRYPVPPQIGEVRFGGVDYLRFVDGREVYLNFRGEDELPFFVQVVQIPREGNITVSSLSLRDNFARTRLEDTLVLAVTVEAEVEGAAYQYSAEIATYVARQEGLPGGFYLYPNFPNPFNAYTAFRFELGKSASVDLTVYDLKGRRVRTLLRGELPAGGHMAVWDGRDERGDEVGSGLYLCRLQTADRTFQQVRAMVLVR
ncbi:MAG TPA: T9SS type A sorting domain-containing protein [Candidatus Latescibacteria bacterium]|nr:T9SS type A sorting domain-containing protein [Candidatus Latescibacterota bacterium]